MATTTNSIDQVRKYQNSTNKDQILHCAMKLFNQPIIKRKRDTNNDWEHEVTTCNSAPKQQKLCYIGKENKPSDTVLTEIVSNISNKRKRSSFECYIAKVIGAANKRQRTDETVNDQQTEQKSIAGPKGSTESQRPHEPRKEERYDDRLSDVLKMLASLTISCADDKSEKPHQNSSASKSTKRKHLPEHKSIGTDAPKEIQSNISCQEKEQDVKSVSSPVRTKNEKGNRKKKTSSAQDRSEGKKHHHARNVGDIKDQNTKKIQLSKDNDGDEGFDSSQGLSFADVLSSIDMAMSAKSKKPKKLSRKQMAKGD